MELTQQRQETGLRLASDKDGETIANLCMACRYHILENTDWSRVYPYWVVAEMGGLIVGAAQVCLGRPVGRTEFLAVEPELGRRDRAEIVKALAKMTSEVHRREGAQIVSFMISDDMEEFREVLEKRGAVPLFHGTTLVKRLV